jgi:hypothetical protein
VAGYTSWLPKQLPGGFSRTQFIALMKSTGQLLDAQEDFLRQAVLAGFPTKGALDLINFPTNPQYALAPSDALDAIGSDRGLPRAVAESPADNGGTNDQAYAARLLGAWEAWKYGGSHYGLLRALALAGYTDMVIVQQNGRDAQLTGSTGTVADLSLGALMTCADRLNPPWTSLPPGWDFSGYSDNTFWSIFGLVFTADASNLQSNGDGSLSPGQVAIARITEGWKPSEMAFFGSYVILAGNVLGWPTSQTLGSGETLGGNSVRIIPGDGTTRAFVEGP